MKNLEIYKNFKKEIEQKKISASYLFYGDRRVDLLFYALEFSKMAMTAGLENSPAEKEKIEKSVDTFQNPDVEIINRENENIKIDEIREIIYSSIESSFNSPKKIFILCGIENIRKESSNALLKILEEPPKNVYFILLSKSLDIIPTIKSRTIKFHLESPAREELGVDEETYYFFDGNEKYIKKYKESGISIEDYRIESTDEALNYIFEMKEYENEGNTKKDDIEFIINYNKSVKLISKKVRSVNVKELYILINRIENEFKSERVKLIELLGKLIVFSKRRLDEKSLKGLVELKNSIRSNVNIRSVLFNFFTIL